MPTGVPAAAILGFLQELEAKRVNMHGFMMLSGGQVAAQGYWRPIGPNDPHRLFSVGKSLTSLAIGMLQGDGLLSISDPIVSYFEDKLPSPVPEWIAHTTIRDMLRMSSPHQQTTYKRTVDIDWAGTFFTVPPTNEPGAVFAYDTSATHTLAALVERLSGESLLSFLKRRLLDPLGCTGPLRWLPDPSGVCQGGSGLIMPLHDLMRVAACCMRGGDGLVPEDYLAEATGKQIDTCLQGNREEQFGYGYQFWRTRHNGFAMYGMGGQLAVCLPDHDFILGTLADTQLDTSGVEAIYTALWNMLPALQAPTDDSPEDAAALQAKLDSLAIAPTGHTPAYEVWPSGRYVFAPNSMGLVWVEITRHQFTYENASGVHTLSFGVGALEKAVLPDTGETCYASAGFCSPGVFRLTAHVPSDDLYCIDMIFSHHENRLTIKSRCSRETPLPAFIGIASGTRQENA